MPHLSSTVSTETQCGRDASLILLTNKTSRIKRGKITQLMIVVEKQITMKAIRKD